MQLRPKFTIGAKLIFLLAFLLSGSVASLVLISTHLFVEDNTATIEKMSADSVAHLALELRNNFETIMDKMRLVGAMLLQDEHVMPGRADLMKAWFAEEKDLLAVYVHEYSEKPMLRGAAVAPEIETQGDHDGAADWAALAAYPGFQLENAAKGGIEMARVQLPDELSAVALSIPLTAGKPGGLSEVVTALIRSKRIDSLFDEQSIQLTYLVDGQGRLFGPSMVNNIGVGEPMSQVDIVRRLISGNGANGALRFEDPIANTRMLGAYQLVGFGGLGVVTEVPEEKAYAIVKRVEYRSALVGLMAFFIAFLAGYLYSDSISWPIRQLVKVAQRISDGDFNINLRPRSHDEVAELAVAFNQMAKGLKERELVKETFRKFHNREVAEKLLSGDVKLGGERREATVLFSDIRGFTQMSEAMEPEAVVEMLNEYMTSMVAVIRKHGGIIDKYVGDAIVAVWGVPLTGVQDPYNAIIACLEMREALARLNEKRLSRGQKAILIGMGLNTGPVIAGNIGSDQKMEYTVIGDTVNVAARVEALTKDFGVDLLVSKSVREEVGGLFLFERGESAWVKGKSSQVEVYSVAGYVSGDGKRVLIETPYSRYSPEARVPLSKSA